MSKAKIKTLVYFGLKVYAVIFVVDVLRNKGLKEKEDRAHEVLGTEPVSFFDSINPFA